MRAPVATYRLQFTPQFGFKEATAVIPYLARLGISHLYASPVFHAKKGSMHGYDIIDPCSLNPELGTVEEFEALVAAVKRHGMGWLQDIVPNHMAYTGDNALIMDVLEKGDGSPYAGFFDIDWEHPYGSMHCRVLAPFLGSFYGEALEKGEIRLAFDERGLSVNYYELRLPLRIESYTRVFSWRLAELRRDIDGEQPDFLRLLGMLYSLKNLPAGENGQELSRHVDFIKRGLWELYCNNAVISRYIDVTLAAFNGTPGDPESFNLLDGLLAEQLYRLSFWKVASEELNYRRFFIINDLISLHAEKPEVIAHTHRLIYRYLDEGKFDALRVDHIDGLYDPGQYLSRLRERAGDRYIVVEKILQMDEELPERWPVEGTTGYDFLAWLNGLFCDRRFEHRFDRIYQRFLGLTRAPHYATITFEKKMLIIGKYMAGDVDELAQLIKRYSTNDRQGTDITLYGLKRALVDILALFPVYRTYVSPERYDEKDRKIMESVIARAREISPGLVNELNFIEKFLLLRYPEYMKEDEKRHWLHFVMRLQQLTGPLMAKGFEDTVLYVFNRFIALNEVGGDPGRFGISAGEFNDFIRRRKERWPLSLNATSTHDTKRGEDARARLNVLSELPEDWRKAVRSWSRLNAPHRTVAGTREMPARNDEYFFYQTLVGSWPFQTGEQREFIRRVKEYMIKAVREAKIYTAWLKPDENYESAFLSFIDAALKQDGDNAFLAEFLPFVKKVAYYGIFNSLSQTLIKITAPGVPDLYQGSELWNLSMVDPDNRRPVDFTVRETALDAMLLIDETHLADYLAALCVNAEDGRLKLFMVRRALALRAERQTLFEEGEYLPLVAEGKLADHVFAFARRHAGTWSITVVPRFLTAVARPGELPLGEHWTATQVNLPAGAPKTWRNVITGVGLEGGDALPVRELFRNFPGALLSGGG